jgi:hypothetical protein
MNCNFCPKTFKIQNELIKHLYTECIKPELLCNIYNFNHNLLGSKIYENENGGDIYIIQKDKLFSSYYKIGMTKDLDKRYSQYKCGNLLDPIIYYYYPFRNIGNIDRLLKKKLKKYKFKKEIYKSDNLNEIRDIIKYLQFELDDKMIELTPNININLKLLKNNEKENNIIIPANIITSIPIENYNGVKPIFNTKTEINKMEIKNDLKILDTEPLKNDLLDISKYKCPACKKKYSSKSGLWYHNTKPCKKITSKYNCNKCNKEFNNRQNKWKHEKICKI